MSDEDHAAEAQRLRAIRTAIATGDTVQMSRFKDNEVAYFAANLPLLERMIAEEEALASPMPVRRRYAAGLRFRRS